MVVIVILVMIVVMRRRRIMLDYVVVRHVMSVSVVAIEFVADGMVAPVGMTPFPIVEARRAASIQGQPDVVGSQIIILATNNADKFDAVPDISIRNADFHRNGRSGNCYHGCRQLDFHRRSRNLHRDYRPGHQ